MKGLMIELLVLTQAVFLGVEKESLSAISFIEIPQYGSFTNLKGKVLNADPDKFAVAVYIKVNNIWWTKPYWDNPTTKINKDGTWECDITTGGFDETATMIAAYLVPIGFDPPLASGSLELPQEIEKKALAKTEIKRTKTEKTEKLRGVCYGPFRDKENPDMGIFPLLRELGEDIDFIPQITRAIRTYGCANTPSNIPVLCEKFEIDCYLGAWLGKYKIENEKEIESIVSLANQNIRSVKGLIIGNEVLLRNDLTEQELIAHIKEVRQITKIPITTAEIWSVLNNHPKLIEEVDFLTVHIHPYWEGCSIDDAVGHVVKVWQMMKDAFPNKRIIIGETGWPSSGKIVGGAVPSEKNQARFLKEFIEIAEKKGIEYFYFELFDEGWKDKFEGETGAHWGIYNSDGSLKEQFKDLLPQEAHQVITRPAREVSKVRVVAPLVVYKDGVSEENRFQPSGWMGDLDCFEVDRACKINPHSGETCAKIVYNPNSSLFRRWSGIYWQYPLNNWGDYPGYELFKASKLTFWARGEKGKEMAEFKTGGIRVWRKPYCDSFGPVSTGVIVLSSEWKKYTLDLKSCDTSNVIGGFCFVTNRLQNSKGCTIYLDDIQFEP
jgi:exo-beta-1,3-glucanase (GH17 family)